MYAEQIIYIADHNVVSYVYSRFTSSHKSLVTAKYVYSAKAVFFFFFLQNLANFFLNVKDADLSLRGHLEIYLM